jgi:hypothetical protein
MKVLLWLMIPMVALIVGIIWASIRARPPRPAAMQDTMASFSRFRRALAAHAATQSATQAATQAAADAAARSVVTSVRDHPDAE